jgi:molecular chaperone GrpE
MIDETKKNDQETQPSASAPEELRREEASTPAQEPTVTEPNYKELFLRTSADLQNFQRRIERERLEWAQLMQADIVQKFIPFCQDLDRAIESSAKTATTPQAAELLEGFKLIAKNLHKTMIDLGIQEVSTTGPFNPELHEALMTVESPNHKSGDIVQVLDKGYTFKGKVLKHARVSVAK